MGNRNEICSTEVFTSEVSISTTIMDDRTLVDSNENKARISERSLLPCAFPMGRIGYLSVNDDVIATIIPERIWEVVMVLERIALKVIYNDVLLLSTVAHSPIELIS